MVFAITYVRINLQSGAYIDVHGTNTEDPTKHKPKAHCNTRVTERVE